MPRPLVNQVWHQRFGSMEPLIYDVISKTTHIDPPRGSRFKRLGKYTDNTGYDDFANAWADYFAPMFLVSRQAMRIRLENLDLLHREVPRQKRLVGLA